MPQVRKDEVGARIRAGALRAFARAGYERATMSDVAREADVSTGNLYRYFESKEELFEAALGDTFVTTFRALLRARVRALAGIVDVAALPEGSDFAVAAEELLRFSVEHRLRVVVLLGRAAGSRYAGVAEDTVAELVALATTHFAELGVGAPLAPPERYVLERIYRNLLATTVDVLADHEDEASIRSATARFSAYHLAGLRAFFAR